MTESAESIHGKTGPVRWVNGGNLFIPISLGNHFYSSEVLRRLLVEFVSRSRTSIIFLCDRLRVLSYRIRGETNIGDINAKIQVQLNQITRALNNVGLRSHPNATVADWSFVQEDPRYVALVFSLEDLVLTDPTLHGALSTYATQLLSRFREKPSSEEAMAIQIQYIIEETSLSMYMTEVRGFNVEVYRRGMGFVDYLYSQRSDDVKNLTITSKLNRIFVAIEDCLPPKATTDHWPTANMPFNE